MSSLYFFVVSPVDYLELSNTLSFAICETRRCKNMTIVDDLVDEPDEFFNYTLERTPDLDRRISLDPKNGRISIIDDDGKILLLMGMCVAVNSFSTVRWLCMV